MMLKIPTATTPLLSPVEDLKIPTDASSAHDLLSPALPDLRIPTDLPDEDCPRPAESEQLVEMTPEEIAEGLRQLARRGVRLSGKRGRGIRTQLFFGPKQATLFKLTTMAVSIVAGRPVTQALVQRLALVRLAREANGALKDPAVADALRADLEIARGAE
jgi:hypothetical protein